MFGMACPFRSQQHQIIHPPLESWLKRESPREVRDSLFVYYHLRERTYVIAMWTRPGMFMDMVNLGFTLGNFDRQRAQLFLEQLNKPRGVDDLKKKLRTGEREYNTKMAEMMEERKQQFKPTTRTSVTV
jgi:hypothetical protein